MQIYAFVLNLGRENQTASREARVFIYFRLQHASFFFSRTVIPSLVSDQKPLFGYLDLGATTRRGARISNHADFSGCGFGPRTLSRFGG